jgi:hypothetical protein
MFRCSMQRLSAAINRLSRWNWKQCIEIFHLERRVAAIMWWWFGSRESVSFSFLFFLFSIRDSSLVYENLKVSCYFFLSNLIINFLIFFCSFEFLFELIFFSILSFNILFNLILISNLVIIFVMIFILF